MSAFKFIAKIDRFQIETDGEGYRAIDEKNNSVTGIFLDYTQLIGYIDNIINPMKCEKCNDKLVTESVTGKDRCLTCEPFYNQPCRICEVKRIFCCC